MLNNDYGDCSAKRENPTGCTAPPTFREGNKIRDIEIREVDKGYIVRVGCCTFAIETKESLITKLAAYISEPLKTEEKWSNKELF